ncbi:hypothetical protein QYE76_058441 [Lolium multiflorum]|uniref:Ribonuclease H n=1 Tax=Lolium multiflorum TaxID=4521 RepID=A0AAD8WPW5_LOLMU|nr:hypothetical protein QYE76_058435 [Lolium multiflorum]KAK1670282.1 hypothetical protein QYE76_058441 [Lolium multiflorum]
MMYYVVFEGRVPGVYEEWEECKKQVHKFSGNCYKGYPTRHEAVAKWRAHQAKKSKMKTFLVLSLLLTIVAAWVLLQSGLDGVVQPPQPWSKPCQRANVDGDESTVSVSYWFDWALGRSASQHVQWFKLQPSDV